MLVLNEHEDQRLPEVSRQTSWVGFERQRVCSLRLCVNLVMALKMESWTACVLLVCVSLLGEGELFAFAVGWVTEKWRLSDKEKKNLFLVCYGLCSGTGLKDLERGVGTWAAK